MTIYEPRTLLPRGPSFEAAVLAHFRGVLVDCCTRWVLDPSVDLAGLHVTFTVLTTTQLTRARDEIERLAHRFIPRQLPGARVTVRFYINDRLASPGYRVEPVPAPSVAAGTPTEHLPPDGGPTEPAYFPSPRRLRLTLRYGVLQWAGPLTRADQWVPVGRGLAFTTRYAPIDLRDFGESLPRGALLQIRHWADQVRIRRTTNRPEYVVRLDGRQLPPNAQTAVDHTGIIEYLMINSRSAGISYELTWEE